MGKGSINTGRNQSSGRLSALKINLKEKSSHRTHRGQTSFLRHEGLQASSRRESGEGSAKGEKNIWVLLNKKRNLTTEKKRGVVSSFSFLRKKEKRFSFDWLTALSGENCSRPKKGNAGRQKNLTTLCQKWIDGGLKIRRKSVKKTYREKVNKGIQKDCPSLTGKDPWE